VREWPYEYKAVFSPVDVIEEYTRPARYVEFGKLVTRPRLRTMMRSSNTAKRSLTNIARSSVGLAPSRVKRYKRCVPWSLFIAAAGIAATPPHQPTPLAVPGFEDASHVGPRDLSAPRPLVVVLHGNYDRPEWECELWSDIIAGAGWILCPRGVRRAGTTVEEDRWTYPSRAAARKEMEAAVAVMRMRYPGKIGEGLALLVGMSLGATYGAALAVGEPAHWPHLVLVEGGTSVWTDATAKQYAASGGHDVVFVCGQPSCAKGAEAAAAALRRAGVNTDIIVDLEAGHNYSDKIIEALKKHCRGLAIREEQERRERRT
jgi:hypothetical protein